jgi:hypothetical protein
MARALPFQSIVGGSRLQPRDSDLKALGYSDVTPAQAAEIDLWYQELMHYPGSRGTSGADNATGSPARK